MHPSQASSHITISMPGTHQKVPVPVNPVPLQTSLHQVDQPLPEPPRTPNLAEIFQRMEPLSLTSTTQISSNISDPSKPDDKDKPKPPGPRPKPGPNPPDNEECGKDEDFQKEVENSQEIKKICEQIVAKIPEDACGVHPPQHKKEVIKINSKCPPRHATIRHRLPSPEPDTIERVTVVKPAQDCIDIIIEKPSMPHPCMIERTEHEQPLSPLVRHNVICVPPSSKCPPGYKLYEPLPQAVKQNFTSAPSSTITTAPASVPITQSSIQKEQSAYYKVSPNYLDRLSSATAPIISSLPNLGTPPFSMYSLQVPMSHAYPEFEVPVTIRVAQTPIQTTSSSIQREASPKTESDKIESTAQYETTSEFETFENQRYSWPETSKQI